MLYPIVKFKCGREKIIEYESFSLDLPGLGVCVRQAIPLKLAWAITIHKSQGMTLDYAKVDISHAFEDAQTYVALSRVTDENGLELRGFSVEKVMTNDTALAFYKNPYAVFPLWNKY